MVRGLVSSRVSPSFSWLGISAENSKQSGTSKGPYLRDVPQSTEGFIPKIQ